MRFQFLMLSTFLISCIYNISLGYCPYGDGLAVSLHRAELWAPDLNGVAD
jgi:hypothetical protein